MKLVILMGICFVLLGCQANEHLSISVKDPDISSNNGLKYYQKRVFTGELVTYYGEDVLLKRRSEMYIDGRRHGEALKWYPNGGLAAKRHYIKGRKHGEQFGWYPNGKKKFYKEFNHGTPIRETWQWYPTGELAFYQKFDKSTEVVHKKWLPSGKVVTNYVVQNREPIGLFEARACSTASQETILERISTTEKLISSMSNSGMVN